MVEEEDYRLEDEEDWMYGAKLERWPFTAPTPDWDHEHCVLCWAKFMEPPHTDVEHGGLVWGYDRSPEPTPLEERSVRHGEGMIVGAPGDEKWICEECFGDFEQRFGWSAVTPDEQ